MNYDFGSPNTRQEEFFRAQERFIAYGGARGGGKSWAVRKKAALLALQYPGIRMLLVRRTLPEVRENHILPLITELKGLAEYKKSEEVMLFTWCCGAVFLALAACWGQVTLR
ncbi:hypothetical protein [Pygmaiobacter massiliensis]|uniref:hypothetical protein n=1 Tax=Pygmaiobacter massiliensis TaxID=1917873 RepID=UPI000C7DEC95|nr:hypothetical protein [Pygmaiobacter massiliensis]